MRSSDTGHEQKAEDKITRPSASQAELARHTMSGSGVLRIVEHPEVSVHMARHPMAIALDQVLSCSLGSLAHLSFTLMTSRS